MGAGGGGTRQRQFKKNNKVFPRKLLIKNMYIYIPADSGQKNICQRRKKKKKRFPLYMYTVCHASRTMTDMSKLIPHTKHSFVASRSQVPDSSLRSEHFRFVAQTCRGQSVSFCIICTTSWAVFHLSMPIVRLVLTADAV